MLSALGGALGVAIGVVVTYGYARSQGWLFDMPIEALAGGVGASLLIGAVAGLYRHQRQPDLTRPTPFVHSDRRAPSGQRLIIAAARDPALRR